MTAPYIPPLRFHFLTRFYDGLVRWTTREAVFKEALLAQLGQTPGERLLDVGCGTATLSVALARRFPEARVAGLDADGAALGIARSKAAGARARLELEQAFADRMPFLSASFDAAVSSLFFHHLTRAAKTAALAEIFRVLKPGGSLHVADGARDAGGVSAGAGARRMGNDARQRCGRATADDVSGGLPRCAPQEHQGGCDGLRSACAARR